MVPFPLFFRASHCLELVVLPMFPAFKISPTQRRFFVLAALALASCTNRGPEMGEVQRLNGESGNLARFLVPYYNAIVALPEGGAVAFWMEQTGGGYQPFFLSRAEGAATAFTPREPLSPPEFLDTISGGPSVLVGPGAQQVGIAWQARRPRTGDKYLLFRGTSDGGRTWSDVRQFNSQLTSFAARLAADRAGGIFAGWSDERATKREVYFNRSLDSGASWSSEEVRVESGVEQVSLEGIVSVASDGDKRVLLVWAEREARSRVIRAALSEDRGATFLPAVRVDDGEGRSSPMAPVAAFAGTRAVVVWITAAIGADIFSQVWADTSADGKEWGADLLVRDQPGGVAPTVNLVSEGARAHLVFDVATRGRETEAVFHTAVNANGVWAPSTEALAPVSPPLGKCKSPNLAHDAKGTLYLVYEEDSRRVQLARSVDGGGTWKPPVLIYERDETAPVATVRLPQVAAANGVAYVLWEEWGDVRSVVKTLGDLRDKRAPGDLFVRRVTFRD